MPILCLPFLKNEKNNNDEHDYNLENKMAP